MAFGQNVWKPYLTTKNDFHKRKPSVNGLIWPY